MLLSMHSGGCVSVFRPGGEFVASFGKVGNPCGIAIDDDGISIHMQ